MQLYKLEYIIGRLRFKVLTQNISKREFNSGFLMHMSHSRYQNGLVSRDTNGKNERKRALELLCQLRAEPQ